MVCLGGSQQKKIALPFFQINRLELERKKVIPRYFTEPH